MVRSTWVSGPDIQGSMFYGMALELVARSAETAGDFGVNIFTKTD